MFFSITTLGKKILNTLLPADLENVELGVMHKLGEDGQGVGLQHRVSLLVVASHDVALIKNIFRNWEKERGNSSSGELCSNCMIHKRG